MSVITISREFGSVGDDFGEGIAHELGYHCLCKEEIASLLADYGMVEFDYEYETRPGFWEGFAALRDHRRSQIVDMLNQVMKAVAHHGNTVIQGRSGYAALKNLTNVLHVRVQAPLAVRIERVALEQTTTPDKAAAVVTERDRVRKAFVEQFYGASWDAIHAFDLVINLGKVSPDLARSWIVESAKALALNSSADKSTTRSMEVDSVLAKTVSEMLRCQTTHG